MDPTAIQDRTAVDLFAGCGGLSLGLHEAGWRTLCAIEKDPMAFETLEANFMRQGAPYAAFSDWPEWLPRTAHDLTVLLADEVTRRRIEALAGTVTLVAGGPPCQGFSVGGRRDGLDQRNKLVHSMLEFVRLVQPPLVLVENVEGITKGFISKPGEGPHSVAEQVVEILEALGYGVQVVLADASRFGVPQVRRRVLIFAVDRSMGGLEAARQLPEALERAASVQLAALGLPKNRAVTVGEALEDLSGERRVVCPDSQKFDAGTYKHARSTYARLMRRGIGSDCIPDSHRLTKHGREILALYRAAHQTQPPGRLSKEFLLSWGTKKDKKVLLDPDAPASTITTHPDEFIHYAAPRNVTVREMARLQSFPDDFVFRGRYTINGPRRRFDVARCSQVGNAVPPLLARGIGAAMLSILEQHRTGARSAQKVA
jgi:DNA (cytosine-5)-methyltransferase 1